ncbi:AIR carboxylase family protein [bacterium]|nr:AIR carboxylase family protein [bacterium]
MKDKKILFILGSKSDHKYFAPVEEMLRETGISYELKFLSAHRNTVELVEFCQSEGNNYSSIVAAAGFSAALPGLVASLVNIPVIGVPISSSPIKIDSLFSMIEMPKGVPLAVVSYDKTGFQNSVLLSLRIMGDLEKYEAFKKRVLG